MERGRILVDLGKLRSPHVGLGEVSRRFADELARQLSSGPGDLDVDYLVPPRFHNAFPMGIRTRPIGLHHVLLPVAGRYDVWHALHQDSSLRPVSARCRVVLTIHDLNFLYEKGRSWSRLRLQELQRKVERATVVTTISHYTAGEIAEHLHLRGRVVEVVPNGVADLASSSERPAFLPNALPMLFTVAHLTRKKNVHVLLDLAPRLTEYVFVIAGNKESPYGRHLEARIRQERIGNVFLPGEVTEDEKGWLHRHAAAFLFPSLLEGFGLPVVEALSCGRPVFVSRATALPEVVGDAGFFFDSFEPEAMERTLRGGLEAYHADPEGHAARARATAARFRWDENVRRYLELYRRLAGLSIPIARTGEA